MAREYWVGTSGCPELYGPYSSEQDAKQVRNEHKTEYTEPLYVTNDDDAY